MVWFSSVRKLPKEEIPLPRVIRGNGCCQQPGAIAFKALVRQRAELFGLSPALPELATIIEQFASNGRNRQPSDVLACIDPEKGVKRGPGRYITIQDIGQGQLLRPITLTHYHLDHLMEDGEAITRIVIDELGARLSIDKEEVMRVEACMLPPMRTANRAAQFEQACAFILDLTDAELPVGRVPFPEQIVAENRNHKPWAVRYAWSTIF